MKIENVVIRKAKPSELRTVQDLNAALFKSDGPRDKYLNHQWPYEEGEKYFKKIIRGDRGRAICLVAEVDGEIVGYLAGAVKERESWRTIKKRIELEDMFVKKEYRSKGVGSKLVKEFFKWSKNKKATRALVSAYATNSKAIKFYKRNTFKPYSYSLEADLNK